VLHEWTPSSLYGLNSLTPHGLAHMVHSSVPRRRKDTIAYITALLRPVFPPFSIHLRSYEPIIRGLFPMAVALSFPLATARQIVT
jgi:hypothetical protein